MAKTTQQPAVPDARSPMASDAPPAPEFATPKEAEPVPANAEAVIVDPLTRIAPEDRATTARYKVQVTNYEPGEVKYLLAPKTAAGRESAKAVYLKAMGTQTVIDRIGPGAPEPIVIVKELVD